MTEWLRRRATRLRRSSFLANGRRWARRSRPSGSETAWARALVDAAGALGLTLIQLILTIAL
jgi:hypothetical protein